MNECAHPPVFAVNQKTTTANALPQKFNAISATINTTHLSSTHLKVYLRALFSR